MDNWNCLIAQVTEMPAAKPAAPPSTAASTQTGTAAPATPAADQPSPFGTFAPLLFIVVLGYFLLWRPEKRRQRELKEQIESIKKNDRVVTIGGIYGVVTNIHREADRITLRVDESNNTKIDVTAASIVRVLTDQPSGDKPA